MSNVLKYIIIVGHLIHAFTEESEETIICMDQVLSLFMKKDRSEDNKYLDEMINTYGRDNVERALNCLADMYKKII